VARFDWYQATVRAEVPAVRAALLGLVHGAEAQPIRGRHGFAFADRVTVDGVELGQVSWGGMHTYPHAHVSGEAAQSWAEVLRAEFPDHSVSRADVCIDYADPGAYDRLQGLALGVAKERGISVGTAGDHLLTMQGRTVYLGATSSHTRVRIYDKGAELRQQFRADPVRLAEVPAELARLEVQVRPQTPAAKAKAAELHPLAVMGSAAWTRELMRQVAAVDLEPFEAGKGYRQADDDRAYAACLAQYGGMLRRMAERQGWAVLGLQIRDDLAAREEAKRCGRGR
jgi:hypothetical protein